MQDSSGEPSGFIEGDEFDPDVIAHVERQEKENMTLEVEGVRNFLEARKGAYAEVFSAGPTSQVALDVVLVDLAAFCRVFASTYSMMDDIHADTLMKIKEGRREVFQRITDHTRLDRDRLFIKYTDAINRK